MSTITDPAWRTEPVNLFVAMRARARVLTSEGPKTLSLPGVQIRMNDDQGFEITFDDGSEAVAKVAFSVQGTPQVDVVLGKAN